MGGVVWDCAGVASIMDTHSNKPYSVNSAKRHRYIGGMITYFLLGCSWHRLTLTVASSTGERQDATNIAQDQDIAVGTKGRATLRAFSGLPAEHENPVQTTHPITSVVAPVRSRTVRTTGAWSQEWPH